MFLELGINKFDLMGVIRKTQSVSLLLNEFEKNSKAISANFEFSHNVELFDETNHIAIFKANEEVDGASLFQGQLVIENNGFAYFIVSTSFSEGGKIADEQAITKIHENFGYMLGRILLN